MSLMTLDPTNKITNDAVPAGANIDQAKIQHRLPLKYDQSGGADVAADNKIILARAYASSTVLAAYATPDAVPAGGSKTATIDLQKSTGGGAFASILTGTTTITSSAVARTPIALSLSGTPTLVAGDVLKIIITTTGSGGTNVQGLGIVVNVAENGA